MSAAPVSGIRAHYKCILAMVIIAVICSGVTWVLAPGKVVKETVMPKIPKLDAYGEAVRALGEVLGVEVKVPETEEGEIDVVQLIPETIPILEKAKNRVMRNLTAGFIYIGPIGDYGWTHGHDVGRRYVDAKFPWLKTIPVEKVPEGPECVRYIDRLVEQGCQVIFTTSWGFMDATIEAAEKHPDIIFFHCSGYKRAKNVGTYFAEFYQLYYLNGLMAGALTKTNKIGYVGAHPTPEVIRHINAFAIGAKEVNPNVKVYVRWIHEWYDPVKAREAAEALIAEGCDVLAFTEDSPAVIQVCQDHYDKGEPVYTFSHYSPMLKYGPDVVVSGQLVRWEKIYEDIIVKVYLGVYNTTNLKDVDYWWMLKEGAVELGADYGVPINPKFIPILNSTYVEDPLLGKVSVYQLVMIRLQQMKEEVPTFDPFTGPLYDQDGNLRARPGERLGHDALWTMDWFLDNIIGSPKG